MTASLHRKKRSGMFRPSIEKIHAFAVELAAATASGDIYAAAAHLAKSPFFQPLRRCECCKSDSLNPLEQVIASLGHLHGEAIAHGKSGGVP